MPGRLVGRLAKGKQEASPKRRAGRAVVFPPRRRPVDRLPGAGDRSAAALLADAQPRRAALGAGDGRAIRERWRGLKQFIERYGGDLFTQRFMNLGNLRGILHQGVPRIPGNPGRRARPRRRVSPAGRIGQRHPVGRSRPLAGRRHRSGRGELRRVRRLQQHHHAVGSRRHAVHAAGFPAACGRITTGWPGTCGRWCWPTRCWCAAAATGRPKSGAAPWPSGPSPIAEEHLKRFHRLCKKYGMRLPSIAEHLGERFVRPLEIDRLCALLRPAIDEIRGGRPAGGAPATGRAHRPLHPRAGGRRLRVAQLAGSPGARDGTHPVASGARKTKRSSIRSSVSPRFGSRGPRSSSRSNNARRWDAMDVRGRRLGIHGDRCLRFPRVLRGPFLPQIHRQEQLERAGGHLPHPGETRVERRLRRHAVIVATADPLQPREQHRRQPVSAGHGAVDHVLLANDQRLVVGGGVEEPAVLPIGEARQNLVGQTHGLIEPCAASRRFRTASPGHCPGRRNRRDRRCIWPGRRASSGAIGRRRHADASSRKSAAAPAAAV